MAIVLPKFPRGRLSSKSRVTRRSEPALGLKLLALQPGLEPGELLEFECSVQRIAPEEVDRLEVSVVWYTEGKGSEDFGVHFFDSLSSNQLQEFFDAQPRRISTTLPPGPLSYQGKLLSIRWCVRLRLFLSDGRDFTTEQPFCLGHITVEV